MLFYSMKIKETESHPVESLYIYLPVDSKNVTLMNR